MRLATTILIMLSSLLSVGLTACSSPPTETAQHEAIPVTADGLQLVVDEKLRKIFLKPGAHLKDFSQILIDPFMVSYTNSSEATGGPVRTLELETEERLTSILHDGLSEAIERSRSFDIVEQPGPEAVRAQGWLYDVVVGEAPSQDSRNATLCFTETAVILTVRHSQTAQALARVVHRAKISCETNDGRQFQTAQWRDVKAGLKPWARLLSESLEDLRELTLDPDQVAP